MMVQHGLHPLPFKIHNINRQIHLSNPKHHQNFHNLQCQKQEDCEGEILVCTMYLYLYLEKIKTVSCEILYAKKIQR